MKETTIVKSKIKSVYFSKLKCLNDVCIEFDKPLTAIMGVNGVGKTTVLHALACCFQPQGNGENNRFPRFFTPNTDITWKGSKFEINLEEIRDEEPISTTTQYGKFSDRWSPKYDRRPKKNVYYIGISSCVPEIEIEKSNSRIQYKSTTKDDKVSERVIKKAAVIMNKDYVALTENKSTKRTYMGLKTTYISYSSLSMGTGEQRTLKILQCAYNMEPYSLLLIDEIDLLMHVSALKRLVNTLAEIADSRNSQIIFTTHSPVMESLKDILDIRYLSNINPHNNAGKTLVYSDITSDLIYQLTEENKAPIHIYVEDTFARAIISSIVAGLSMRTKVKILTFGAAQNAFTLASGKILQQENIENVLIVLDGDCFLSADERLTQVKRTLSGTEDDIAEKRECALSLITSFRLPEDVSPEKFMHHCLRECVDETNCNNEIIKAALDIVSPWDSHDWIKGICHRLNSSEESIVKEIVEIISGSEEWKKYIAPICEWLENRRNI